MHDYKKYAVLYVDDEEKSLKYFKKAFDEDFQVLTASSALDAETILKEKGNQVGLVITDQRMPHRTGVELLKKVRQLWPNIVRILTTAYSDLDSAIDAVNSGAIFKYVVKPWNVRELKGTLLRALDYFLIQQERDTLLREKLTVLQRLMVADRVRSLAVMAAGLNHHIRNPLSALKTFLDLTPQRLKEESLDIAALNNPDFWIDFHATAQEESKRILRLIESVGQSIVKPSKAFSQSFDLDELIQEGKFGAEGASEASGGVVHVDIEADLPPFKVDPQMARQLFVILFDQMVKLNSPGKTITLRAKPKESVWGTPGSAILITGDGPEWTEHRVESFFIPLSIKEEDPLDAGTDLLSAFFISHHHGGDLFIHRASPKGPGFEVVLPFDPEATKRPMIEQDYFKKIMMHLDTWNNLTSLV